MSCINCAEMRFENGAYMSSKLSYMLLQLAQGPSLVMSDAFILYLLKFLVLNAVANSEQCVSHAIIICSDKYHS